MVHREDEQCRVEQHQLSYSGAEAVVLLLNLQCFLSVACKQVLLGAGCAFYARVLVMRGIFSAHLLSAALGVQGASPR